MLEEIHKPSGPLTLSSTPIENATFEQPIASSNRACLLLSRSQHLWRQNHKTLTTNKANDTSKNPNTRTFVWFVLFLVKKRSNKQTEWLSIWNQCRCSRRSTPSGPLTLSSTPIKNATFEQPLASSNRPFYCYREVNTFGDRTTRLWPRIKRITRIRSKNPNIRLIRAIRGQIKKQ